MCRVANEGMGSWSSSESEEATARNGEEGCVTTAEGGAGMARKVGGGQAVRHSLTCGEDRG